MGLLQVQSQINLIWIIITWYSQTYEWNGQEFFQWREVKVLPYFFLFVLLFLPFFSPLFFCLTPLSLLSFLLFPLFWFILLLLLHYLCFIIFFIFVGVFIVAMLADQFHGEVPWHTSKLHDKAPQPNLQCPYVITKYALVI